MRILVWWLVLTALGATIVPFVPRWFPHSPDRGFAFARPLAIAFLGFGSWLLAELGVPYGIAIGSTLAGLAVAGGLGFALLPRPSISRLELVRSEIGFAAALLFFAGVRALRPEIFGAEKYMDFAFFNSILRTAAMPPEDPWLAGSPINYYYFGYLLFANLARISGIAPEVAYNLSIATIGAVLFSGATSVGRALSGRFALGLAGGLAASVLGNLDGALQVLVERRGLGNLDYWRSSRVVANTINEFPFFSLLHGDLHPHVTAIVLEIPLAALLLSAAGERSRSAPLDVAPAAIVVVLMAAVAMTNPWDLPLLIALLALLCLRRVWSPRAPLRSVAVAIGLVAAATAAAGVLASPFLRRYAAPLGGVGIVHAHTTLAEALVVFGILAAPIAIAVAMRVRAFVASGTEYDGLALAAIAFVAAAIAVAGQSTLLAAMVLLLCGSLVLLIADREAPAPVWTLVAVGAVAVGLCEVVFLRDPYGSDLHRMNTVFKFYFQAWIYWALAWPVMLAMANDALKGRLGEKVATVALTLLLVCGACYPAAALVTFARNAPGPLGLDGMAYLDRDHPDDARAIRWLRDRTSGRPRILEATGDAYSYFARVSTHTGLPTLLGWANHEGVWRGADPRVTTRADLVRRLYDETDVSGAASLLARQRVRYVFVGELERKTYAAAGLAKFADHPETFEAVFRSGETVVYEVKVKDAGR